MGQTRTGVGPAGGAGTSGRPGGAGTRHRAGAGTGRRRSGAPGRGRPPVAGPATGHRRAGPGRPARGGGGQVRPAGRSGCCSPRTAWSRPPARCWPTTGPPGSRRPGRTGCSTCAAASARTCWPSTGPGCGYRGVERDPVTAALARLNTGRPVLVGTAEAADWRCRARCSGPGPARRARPDLRPGRLLAVPGLRAHGAGRGPVRRRQARPRPGPRAGAGESGGRVGVAGRWGEGGGALVGRLHRPGVRRRASVFPAGVQLTDADPAERRGRASR